MSADNGVYILSTPTPDDGREYRVRDMSAIENLSWDGTANTDDPRVLIENARQMWNGARVFTDHGDALIYATEVYNELPICEYGISTIELPVPFEENTDLEIIGGVLLTQRDIDALKTTADLFMLAPETDILMRIIESAKAEREKYDEIRAVMRELHY